ncbi:hypothetical protein EC991_009225 [Linnemannia zychae]|nr:hypothetical protein EC991_009225 [Linnemannia zychae]
MSGKIQRTNSSKLKNRVPPQIYMCGYKADPEVTIILVNDMSQLELMYESLFYAGVDQDQDLEQQQFGPKQENSKRDSDSESDSDNTSNGTGAGGVFLQLACHNDKRVYVIDLEIFLDKSVDSLHKLPRLLGEIFFNPSICKLEIA